MRLNDYFDGIYWINLHRSEDRRRCMESWLVREGIKATRVEAIDGNALRFLLPEHERDSRERFYAGCLASHLQAFAMSKYAGDKRVLVMEDDVLPRKNFQAEFAKLAAHPTLVNNEWDMLYLGFIPLTDCGTLWSYLEIPPADNLGLARATRNYVGAYAYALSGDMRDLLLEKVSAPVDKCYGIDSYMRNMSLVHGVDYFKTHRIFGTRPQLFAQFDGMSTLTAVAESRFPRSADGRPAEEYNFIHDKV